MNLIEFKVLHDISFTFHFILISEVMLNNLQSITIYIS